MLDPSRRASTHTRGEPYLSDGSGPSFGDLAAIIFPGRDFASLSQSEQNDVMHLMSAIESADVFVTRGRKDFIDAGKREAIERRYAVRVMTDDEAVKHFRDDRGWP